MSTLSDTEVKGGREKRSGTDTWPRDVCFAGCSLEEVPTTVPFAACSDTLAPPWVLGVVGLSSRVDGVNEAAAGESLEVSVDVLVVVEPKDEAEVKGSLNLVDEVFPCWPSPLKLAAVIVRSKAGGTLDLTIPRLRGLLKSWISSGEKVVNLVAGVAR